MHYSISLWKKLKKSSAKQPIFTKRWASKFLTENTHPKIEYQKPPIWNHAPSFFNEYHLIFCWTKIFHLSTDCIATKKDATKASLNLPYSILWKMAEVKIKLKNACWISMYNCSRSIFSWFFCSMHGLAFSYCSMFWGILRTCRFLANEQTKHYQRQKSLKYVCLLLNKISTS